MKELCFQKYKACKDQELKQSEPKLSPQNQKWDITYISNSQNTKRIYGKTSEQLFPKRWALSSRNRTKNNMNTHKVKRHQKSDNFSFTGLFKEICEIWVLHICCLFVSHLYIIY